MWTTLWNSLLSLTHMSYGFRIKHTSHMNQFYNTLCLKLDGSCIHSIEKRSKNIVHTILCSLQTGTEQTFHWNKIKAYLWVNKRYAYCKIKPSSIAPHLICSLKCWINILTPALKFLVFCFGCKSSFSSNNLAPPTRSECQHNFFYLQRARWTFPQETWQTHYIALYSA